MTKVRRAISLITSLSCVTIVQLKISPIVLEIYIIAYAELGSGTGFTNLRMTNIEHSLRAVLASISKTFESTDSLVKTKYPRLVAVSKTKPVEDIIAAYRAGQRNFGENYVKELCSKSNDPKFLAECPDIIWHFISNLQSNKVSKICAQVPNLSFVETVDSENLANLLNSHVEKSVNLRRLKVFVQVNTSGEEQKNGIDPVEAISLAQFIDSSCPRLIFVGFMTIGSQEQSFSKDGYENNDFKCLSLLRARWSQVTGRPIADAELSMGMSSDFQMAIKMGSTNVRVGSTIFDTSSAPFKNSYSFGHSYLDKKHKDKLASTLSS